MCLSPTHFVVDVLRVDAGVPVRAAGPGEDGCRHGLHRGPHLGVGGGLAQAGLRGHSVVSQGSGNTLDLLSIVLYCTTNWPPRASKLLLFGKYLSSIQTGYDRGHPN